MSQPPVSFIGAGPGDPELLTIKAQRLIQEADLVLYAGSLVPREVLSWAKDNAEIMDSSGMTLEQTHAALVQCVHQGHKAARVHTGDPSLYGAVLEQMRLLQQEGIDYQVIPGITAAFAAAAQAGISFTIPELTQTLIFTRMRGRTLVPDKERLQTLAAHHCSLAIYLSASLVQDMVQELRTGGLPDTTPICVGSSVGWPGEEMLWTDLAHVEQDVSDRGITRQAVFLVLPGQAGGQSQVSRLYSPDFSHGFRSARMNDA
ncbi:precorrin-4 C(11)-methyltransferase [Desulfovermiculus halophilus]|uniref:precorrin-4 C(11)-methyltransferase n=1 Tax=Desulfovermiculus halophilus TaxID=339722 RepID=UPI001ABFFFC1|nr:precorrin-4 C(11)-methyltransferase [Desulfovermiculus halophilus]